MQKKLPGLYISIAFAMIFLATTTIDIHAQSIKRQVISSYGSSSVISENVTISQTAGQSYNTIANHTNGTTSQGFQQPPAFTVEEIINTSLTNLNVVVFPNPASHSITIKSTDEISLATIQVSDINGKIYKTEKITNLNEHKINCASWANGIYLITIQDSSKNSKSLRLIILK